MTKRRGSGRKRKPRSTNASISGSDRTEFVPGKILLPISLTGSAVGTIPLTLQSTSLLGSRLIALGTVFQEHRFTHISIILHPGFNATGVTRTGYAIGYFKIPPLNPPTTMVNLYTATASRYSDQGDTVPVRLNLGRRVLLNTVRPWFTNQVAGGSEALDTNQGVLYVQGSGTAGLTLMLEISYMVEMRGPTSPPVD